MPQPWEKFGFPKAEPEDLTKCGGLFDLPPCDRAQFFRDFGKRHPVFAPFTTPVYSNEASVILGFVVEAASGQSYDEFVQQNIFDPIGMTNTSIFTPPEQDAWGFIPQNETWWGATLGYADM
jgi:CubicO group peptidase (beta-lactamase class C family)